MDRKHIKREYTESGVKNWYEQKLGGKMLCVFHLTKWGEKEDIKPCPTCNGMHNRYNPPQCHSCAFGLN